MIITYKKYKPKGPALELILTCSQILQEYENDGFDLTLRQLYYQLVSRDLIENTMKSYNRLKDIVGRARDGGLLSWTQIVDRGRNLYGIATWDTAEAFLEEQADKFHLDPWDHQDTRVEVWVEKDALSSVVGRAANRWRVDYLPNKGYMSASEIWRAGRRMLSSDCDNWVVLHLGDHDPSGIDMTRDIQDRLNLYASPTMQDVDNRGYRATNIEVHRIALNMNQIEEYGPPPNPAKQTDARYSAYADLHGEESWELDALDPNVIVDLIAGKIEELISDPESFHTCLANEESIQDRLRTLTIDLNE